MVWVNLCLKVRLKSETAVNGYLEISFIGYEKKTVPAKADVGIVVLKEIANELGEVVVRGKRPTIRQEAGKMIVGISGSSLSEAGNLMDVFKRTPGLQVKEMILQQSKLTEILLQNTVLQEIQWCVLLQKR